MTTLVALRHCETLTSGHSRPCIVEGETLDEKRHEVVLKLREDVHGKANGLACEWVASQLASALGLNVPAPFLVEVTEEFAESVPDAAARARYHANLGRHFGSLFIGPQTHSLPYDFTLPPHLVDPAAAVIAFDALVGNDDRHIKKSNYLIQGSRVVLIDHERAFPPARHEIRAAAWEPTGLDFIQNHIFLPGVRGQLPAWPAVAASWKGVTPHDLINICRSIPSEWNGDGVAQRVETYLLSVHPQATTVLGLLEAMLR
jgi:hypothetical protein